MRIDADGHVEIPAELRQKAGLLPDTEVSIEFDGTGVRIVPLGPRTRGERIVALLRGKGDIDLSTDEIMAMTRGD